MSSLPDAHILVLAESCVHSMGDVFWDFDERRDATLGFVAPSEVATRSVANTLQTFATTFESSQVYTVTLRLEYRELVARMGNNPTDAGVRWRTAARSFTRASVPLVCWNGMRQYNSNARISSSRVQS